MKTRCDFVIKHRIIYLTHHKSEKETSNSRSPTLILQIKYKNIHELNQKFKSNIPNQQSTNSKGYLESKHFSFAMVNVPQI